MSRVAGGASRIIATGSYIARDETAAEVAFAVDDEFQGKGLGGLLLERLALLAARHGFTRFWALTLLGNQLMLETFRKSGFSIHTKVEDECVEIDFSVAPSEDSVSRSALRDRVFTTASLHPFFRPRSVAVVGASRDSMSFGYRILDTLIASGFRGSIHVVNPNATHVHSLPAYPSVRDIPQAVDLAVVCVPRKAVSGVVEDCAARGVRALVVVTGGFAEADAEGRALQEELLEKVRGAGMRMVGPNSMGLLNTDPEVQLNTSLSLLFPPAGSVAMSSQSGALGLAMLALAQQRHVGLSTFVSVGNRADISGNDLLQYWQGDSRTRVILLYLESFGNPRRFARIARVVSQTKPIVAVKAGRRAASQEAAGPGAAAFMAGEAPVQALFRQTGVIRAETLDEMFDLAAALERQPLPSGRRVAVLADAAGPGILCAGACEAAGLVVSELSEETKKKLASLLPGGTAIGNPLELVASSSPDPYRLAIETLLAAPDVDSLIVIHTPLDTRVSSAILEAIRQGVAGGRASGGEGKPVLACLMAKEDAGTPMVLSGESIPTYAFPESAARVLGKVSAYAVWRAGRHGVIPDFDDIDLAAARAACRGALDERGEDWLTTEEARSVLRAMRLPIADGGVARTAEEAVELARTVGFPVALKLASNQVLHKKEKGAVHLDVADEAGVRRAFEQIQRYREGGEPGPPVGVLVQPMAENVVEVVIRMAEHPPFGPLLTFGLGGIYMEVIADPSVRVTPLTDRAAAAMVREVRWYQLLEGYRGHPPADVDAIKDVLLRVSRLVEEVPVIAELDLSPIFVGPPGEGCSIVGARIRVAPPQKGQAARYTTPAQARGTGGAPDLAERNDPGGRSDDRTE